LSSATTAYSILAAALHIRSRLLHPQPENAPCRGDRYPHNMDKSRALPTHKKTFRVREQGLTVDGDQCSAGHMPSVRQRHFKAEKQVSEKQKQSLPRA